MFTSSSMISNPPSRYPWESELFNDFLFPELHQSNPPMLHEIASYQYELASPQVGTCQSVDSAYWSLGSPDPCSAGLFDLDCHDGRREGDVQDSCAVTSSSLGWYDDLGGNIDPSLQPRHCWSSGAGLLQQETSGPPFLAPADRYDRDAGQTLATHRDCIDIYRSLSCGIETSSSLRRPCRSASARLQRRRRASPSNFRVLKAKPCVEPERLEILEPIISATFSDIKQSYRTYEPIERAALDSARDEYRSCLNAAEAAEATQCQDTNLSVVLKQQEECHSSIGDESPEAIEAVDRILNELRRGLEYERVFDTALASPYAYCPTAIHTVLTAPEPCKDALPDSSCLPITTLTELSNGRSTATGGVPTNSSASTGRSVSTTTSSDSSRKRRSPTDQSNNGDDDEDMDAKRARFHALLAPFKPPEKLQMPCPITKQHSSAEDAQQQANDQTQACHGTNSTISELLRKLLNHGIIICTRCCQKVQPLKGEKAETTRKRHDREGCQSYCISPECALARGVGIKDSAHAAAEGCEGSWAARSISNERQWQFIYALIHDTNDAPIPKFVKGPAYQHTSTNGPPTACMATSRLQESAEALSEEFRRWTQYSAKLRGELQDAESALAELRAKCEQDILDLETTHAASRKADQDRIESLQLIILELCETATIKRSLELRIEKEAPMVMKERSSTTKFKMNDTQETVQDGHPSQASHFDGEMFWSSFDGQQIPRFQLDDVFVFDAALPSGPGLLEQEVGVDVARQTLSSIPG